MERKEIINTFSAPVSESFEQVLHGNKWFRKAFGCSVGLTMLSSTADLNGRIFREMFSLFEI